MEPATGLLSAALLLLSVGVILGLAGARFRLPAWLSWLPGVAGSILAMVAAIEVIGSGRPAVFQLPATLSGFSPGFALDPLGAWLLLAVALTGLVASAAAALATTRSGSGGAATAATHLLLLGHVMFVAASDVVALLLAWQLIAVGGWAAIATRAGGERGAGGSPAYRFLVAMELGAALLALGLLLAAAPGGVAALAFGELGQASLRLGPALRGVVYLLCLGGLATAAGLGPFHAALPRAVGGAPPAASALLAAALPRLGLLGLLRLHFQWLPEGPTWWGALLLVVASLTMLHALLLALAELDLGRLAALIGIATGGLVVIAGASAAIAASLGAPGIAALAIAVSLYGALAHATYVSALALAAGALAEDSGSRNLNHMGGLLRRLPWPGAALLFACLAAAAVPPAGSFTALWLDAQLLLLTLELPLGPLRLTAFAATVALALAAALAPVALLRLAATSLLGPAHGEPRPRPPRLASVAALLPALACVALGLFAGPLLRQLAPAASLLAGHAGTLPGLTLPAAHERGAWPDALASPTPLADLRMPAMLAALVVATLVGLALLRIRTHRVAAPSPHAEVAAGRTRLGASGFAQPIVAALPELYGVVEEATILEGRVAQFPTRVAFHHAIAPWLGARMANLSHWLSESSAGAVRRAGQSTLRARLQWLLVAVLALLAGFAR